MKAGKPAPPRPWIPEVSSSETTQLPAFSLASSTEPSHRVDQAPNTIDLLASEFVIAAPKFTVSVGPLTRCHAHESVDRDQRVVDLVGEARSQRAQCPESIGAHDLFARSAQIFDHSRVLHRNDRVIRQPFDQRVIIGRKA